jgi:ABC-type multidrug transport system ATPase subunit
VGFVWQQGSRNLVPYLTALENIELPMTLAGRNGGRKRKHAEGLLETVGLADRRHHRLAQMSGGEQQRVAIAVALANDPTLLLADEPTGEVDSATALVIYETFRRINRELGVTTLIVSHDPGIARHMNRVVAIRDGKTATETVRQTVVTSVPAGESAAEGAMQEQHDDVYEELVVLDSAGRLQVPKEYLEQFAIKGRARLELIEEGILILPAPQAAQTEAADRLADMISGTRAQGWRSRLLNSSVVVKSREAVAAGIRALPALRDSMLSRLQRRGGGKG